MENTALYETFFFSTTKKNPAGDPRKLIVFGRAGSLGQIGRVGPAGRAEPAGRVGFP